MSFFVTEYMMCLSLDFTVLTHLLLLAEVFLLSIYARWHYRRKHEWTDSDADESLRKGVYEDLNGTVEHLKCDNESSYSSIP